MQSYSDPSANANYYNPVFRPSTDLDARYAQFVAASTNKYSAGIPQMSGQSLSSSQEVRQSIQGFCEGRIKAFLLMVTFVIPGWKLHRTPSNGSCRTNVSDSGSCSRHTYNTTTTHSNSSCIPLPARWCPSNSIWGQCFWDPLCPT